jgi:hypothetical protein
LNLAAELFLKVAWALLVSASASALGQALLMKTSLIQLDYALIMHGF